MNGKNQVLFEEYDEYPSVELRNEISYEYDDLVRSIANNSTWSKNDFDEAYQFGYIGLLGAIERYDLNSGNKFITYATHYIEGCIKNGFRDMREKTTSREVYETTPKVENAMDVLEEKYNRTPTERELANYLNIDLELIREVLIALEHPSILSLNYTYEDGEGSKTTLMDTSDTLFGNDYSQDDFVIDELIDKYTYDFTDDEYYIFTKYFLEGFSQQEIADELNINQTTIGRKSKKLKQIFMKKLVDDYTFNFTDDEYYIFTELYVNGNSLKNISIEVNMEQSELEILFDKLKKEFLYEFIN